MNTDHDLLWLSVQAAWKDANNPRRNREGRPSVAADIARLLFPRRSKGSKTVKRFGLQRPMMREAWFAILAQTQKQHGVDKKVCRKIQGKVEVGNSCLSTPGTCESCPEWHKKTRVG